MQLKVEKSYLKCPKEELLNSVKELSKQLDSVTILCKGPTDIISNGIDGKSGAVKMLIREGCNNVSVIIVSRQDLKRHLWKKFKDT